MLSRLIAKAAILCFTVAALASPLTAQKKPAKPRPDMTGSWLLNQKKSSDSGLTRRPDLPIKISHHDPELRIMRPSESSGQVVDRDFTYFTDGRGETNEATSGLTTNPSGGAPDHLKNQVTSSKTQWSGEKIVIRSFLRLTAAGRIVAFEQIDEWKLSTDGKVLTQRTRIVPETGEGVLIMAQEKKRVYNRV
jgi:hypothetical protein